MVTTRSSQAKEENATSENELPIRKRKAAAETDRSEPVVKKSRASNTTPASDRKKRKVNGTSEPEIEDEIVVGGSALKSPQAGEADTSESFYETPETHPQGSTYATPATHLAKRASADIANTPASHVPKPKASTIPNNTDGSKKASNALSDDRADVASSPSEPTAKPTRIRFSSEEPLPAPPGLSDEATAKELNVVEEVRSEDNDEGVSSDDEAPEAITQTSALESTRHLESDAAKARAAQDAAAKAKRKARDKTLKAQAKAAGKEGKRSKALEVDEADADEDSIGEVEREQDSIPGHEYSVPDGLSRPKLLPQELLDAAPAVRPLSPPVPLAAPVVDTKRNKLAILDPKPPKDVSRGPVKVRVLQNSDPLLAPKAENKVGTQRQIREGWVQGRQGRWGKTKGAIGSGKMERRSWGSTGGFLRR